MDLGERREIKYDRWPCFFLIVQGSDFRSTQNLWEMSGSSAHAADKRDHWKAEEGEFQEGWTMNN